MTDAAGKGLVIYCDKAEASIVFEEQEEKGYLARLAVEEPASYIEICFKTRWVIGICRSNECVCLGI